MNKIDLLKKMLPGFLPIIVFIIADELFGTIWGLIIAIAFAIVELVFGYVKERKLDRFVLFDISLLVALGGVSIIMDNDLFFKLKPGVISLLMTGLIGYSVYSEHNIMMRMSQRYMKGIEINPYQQYQMQVSMKRLFWLFLIYSLATIGSAYMENKAVWSFLGGAGMFVVMGLFLLMEWWTKRKQQSSSYHEEWVSLVNEKGTVLGQAPRAVVHNGSKLLHPVVHLHVLGIDGVWLQLRPKHKQIQPGKWDTAVGGHIDAGETVEQALARETQEEIGIRDFKVRALEPYVWESEVERELVFAFVTPYNGPFNFDKTEVDDVQFFSHQQIEAKLGSGMFTPNFEHEYQKLIANISL